jgi:phosphatidylglycerol:prolipoprotein diacylglycerol transferase
LGVVATAAAPAIPLAQAIGRLGCLLAGDGDYGVPTTLPWGMTFPHGVVPTEEPVHPTPIYESMLYTAVFVYLWQRRTLSAPWDGFGRYLVLSGIARFAVEFVRRNPASALGLTVAQWMSLLGVALGAWIAARARPAPASSAPSMAESIAPRNPL